MAKVIAKRKNLRRTAQALHDAEPGEQHIGVSVYFRLMKCYNLAFRELRKALEKDGRLTYPQFDVLAQLWRTNEGMSFVDLSRRLMVTSGNLTGIVDRLEGQGFVYREPDDKDRRVVWILLTPKGRSLVGEMIPGHVKQIEALFAGVKQKDLRQLRDLLAKLRSAVEKSIP